MIFFYAFPQYIRVIVMVGSQREGSNTNLTLQRGHLLDRRHLFESVLALHLQKSTWLPNSCHLKILISWQLKIFVLNLIT